MNWILVKKKKKYFFLVCYLKRTFWRWVSEICMIYLQDACKIWSLQCQEESYYNALNDQRGRQKVTPWIKKNTSWWHKRPLYLQNSVYAHDNGRTIRTSGLHQTFMNTKPHAQSGKRALMTQLLLFCFGNRALHPQTCPGWATASLPSLPHSS